MKPQLGDTILNRYTLVSSLREEPGIQAWKANDLSLIHISHRGNRLGRVRRDTEAQLGHESHGAHHTQRIVVKGLSRVHRRAQHALGPVSYTHLQHDRGRGL